MTAIDDRHYRRNHLVLPSGERQIRRHQGPEGRKRMIKGVRDQAVRRNNLRRLTISSGMNWYRVFDWIEFALRLHGATYFFVIVGRDRFDPGHNSFQLMLSRPARLAFSSSPRWGGD